MNHAFVTLGKAITPDEMDGVIRGIIRDKWGTSLTIKRSKDEWTIGEYPYGVAIWFGSPRKLEFRKLHPCELSWWIQTFIQESIAKHYNGWCKDEGVGDKWRGTPEKFPPFKAYFDNLHERLPGPFRALMWRSARKSYPKEFLCTDASAQARA